MELTTIGSLSGDIENATTTFTSGESYTTMSYEIVFSSSSYQWVNFKGKIKKLLEEFKKDVDEAGKELKAIDSSIKSTTPKFGSNYSTK